MRRICLVNKGLNFFDRFITKRYNFIHLLLFSNIPTSTSFLVFYCYFIYQKKKKRKEKIYSNNSLAKIRGRIVNNRCPIRDKRIEYFTLFVEED